MKESYGEGVATHTGLESCAGARKGMGEALKEVCAGRVLSCESFVKSGCRRNPFVWKATLVISLVRDMYRTPRSRKPRACTETSCSGTGRSRVWPQKMAKRSAP